MSNTEAKRQVPSRGTKHICVPFASEAAYQACVNDVRKYRQHLQHTYNQHPELFPQAWAQGYTWHDCYGVRKQRCVVRRIKLKATGQVFTVRPSFLLPYGIGRTAEVEKALFVRQWGVPFDARAYGFGRNAMFWYRAWLSFGRSNLVGTTVKEAITMPQELVADEKITWLAGTEVVVPTTVGGGCVLGISVAEHATSPALQTAYGEFKTEATTVFPTYQARSVCSDGFHATRDAWRQLFPHRTLVLCFLHSILNLTERWRGTLRPQVLDRAWFVYHAVTKGQFAQRLRRLGEWGRTTLNGSVAQTIPKMTRLRTAFTPAYDCPQAARTTNAVDRVHTQLARILYAMQYCHGHQASVRLAVRAGALQWNFPPYGPRLRQDQPPRSSPFADLNGFYYHSNWLQNLLIASSMGGLRL